MAPRDWDELDDTGQLVHRTVGLTIEGQRTAQPWEESWARWGCWCADPDCSGPAQVSWGWTRPCCLVCWHESYPGQKPVRRRATDSQTCAWCAASTVSGIFIRADPHTVPYPRPKTLDERGCSHRDRPYRASHNP